MPATTHVLLLALVVSALGAPTFGRHHRRGIVHNRGNSGESGSCFDWKNWSQGPPCVHPPPLSPLNTSHPAIAAAVMQVDTLLTQFLATLKSLNLTLGFSYELVYDQVTLMSKSYGVKDMESMQPPTADTIYRIGSISKVFTSMMYMHAVQIGAVAVDSKVCDFFNDATPPIFNMTNPFNSGPVTLHSLAAQSSGMPREAVGCNFATPCVEETVFNGLNNAALIAPAYALPHYSNLGLALLGRSVERALNTTWENFVNNFLLPTMNMSTGAGTEFTSDVIARMATGYDAIPNGNGKFQQVVDPTNTVNIGWVSPAGEMYCSPRAMGQFLKYIFSEDETIINVNKQREWRLPGNLFPDGVSGFSLGTWEQFYANGFWTTTKGGLLAGFGSNVAYVPELKLGMSVMINAQDGGDPDYITASTMAIVVPAVIQALEGQIPPKQLPTNWQKIPGTYGYNGQVIFTVGQPVAGMFPITAPGLSIKAWYEPDTDYDGNIGMRYYFGTPTQSCFNEYASGSDAVAYFSGLGGDSTAVTASLWDEGLPNIPKIS